MATLKDLENQIETANELGRQNLNGKGVDIPADAATYEIMAAIAEISGGGVIYESIVCNKDNTITLTDKDGNEHIVKFEYTQGKLSYLNFDGKNVNLSYDGDVLVSVGNTAVYLTDAPLKTSGQILLEKAQFTSNFRNNYDNENNNEDYRLSFNGISLSEPVYCENGLDHTVGGYSFNYSQQWKNEILNYKENTIVALVNIVGNVDSSDRHDRQRLFDLYPNNISSSQVGFGNGQLYKRRGTYQYPTTPIEFGKWYVVSLVFKNGKYYTYLDDGIVSTSLIAEKESSDDLIIANFLRQEEWAKLNGYVSNLTYFNRALTSSEITALAETLLSGKVVSE